MRTLMNKPALLLSLLVIGALGLVGGGCGDEDEPTAGSETETSIDSSPLDRDQDGLIDDPSSPPASASVRVEETIDRARRRELAADNTADNKSCGRFGHYRFAVVEGDVSCRVARRVMRANSVDPPPPGGPGGLPKLPGSWYCGGPESRLACVNEAEETFMAACCGTSPWWNKRAVAQRRHPREANRREAKLSREQVQELKREANTWARLFSRRGVCNRYMGQPICQRLDCVRDQTGAPIENCTQVLAAFQKSFADATVEDIKSERILLVRWYDRPIYEAAVKFSNGEVVVFAGTGRESYSCSGPGSGCTWSIAEEDHNRRFIQAATTPPS
jgi:hypothetical protein